MLGGNYVCGNYGLKFWKFFGILVCRWFRRDIGWRLILDKAFIFFFGLERLDIIRFFYIIVREIEVSEKGMVS